MASEPPSIRPSVSVCRCRFYDVWPSLPLASLRVALSVFCCLLCLSLCFGVVLSRTRVATPAALLQCAIDTAPEPASATGAGGAASDGGVEWGDLSAVSVACVGRHCGAIMKACVGLAWEAKVDVPHWLKELENLKVLYARMHAGT